MHKAQAFIDRVIRPAAPQVLVRNLALRADQCQGLQQRLASDAMGYFYSGAFSIGEAAQGAGRGFFTWATVKLYYASFYLFRALLALNGVCLFYDGNKPYVWKADPGELPRKASGNTHKAVLAEFKRSGITPGLLSQQIDLQDPLAWLISKREDANYNLVRFVEPFPPGHFREIDRIGIRRAFAAYVADESFLYAFDQDHAILAYPIEVLKEVQRQVVLHALGYDLSEDDRRYIASLYLDEFGPLPDVNQLLAG